MKTKKIVKKMGFVDVIRGFVFAPRQTARKLRADVEEGYAEEQRKFLQEEHGVVEAKGEKIA